MESPKRKEVYLSPQVTAIYSKIAELENRSVKNVMETVLIAHALNYKLKKK